MVPYLSMPLMMQTRVLGPRTDISGRRLVCLKVDDEKELRRERREEYV